MSFDDLTDVDRAVLQAIGDAGGTGVYGADILDRVRPNGIGEEQVQRSIRFLHERGAVHGMRNARGEYLIVSLSPPLMRARMDHAVPDYEAVRREIVVWLSQNLTDPRSQVRASSLAEQIHRPLASVTAILTLLNDDRLLDATSLLGSGDMMVSGVAETLRRMGEAWSHKA